jgi:hypothetical protein
MSVLREDITDRGSFDILSFGTGLRYAAGGVGQGIFIDEFANPYFASIGAGV